MSRNDPTDWQSILLRYPCRYCGVKAGEWCRLRGRPGHAEMLHTTRTEDYYARRSA